MKLALAKKAFAATIVEGQPLLKRWSKGDDVKDLRRLLGVTVNGSFGSETEAAAIEFQKGHSLLPDEGRRHDLGRAGTAEGCRLMSMMLLILVLTCGSGTRTADCNRATALDVRVVGRTPMQTAFARSGMMTSAQE